jgi:outer membrane lipoprotein-sorting protein
MGCIVKSKTVLALILCGLTLLAWRVAAAQATNPTVDDILARYTTALGGRSAISKHTTRTSKGTLEVVGVTTDGTAESYAKAPNKYLSIINIPEYGQIRRCYDGQTAWVSGPDPTNVQLLTGQDLSSTRRDANFYQSLDVKKLYPQLSLKEKEDVAGFPAYVIEGNSGEGTVRRMYFDVSSGLLVRNDEITDTPQGHDVVQSFLEDYREVEGVKQPHTVRQIHGKIIFIIRLTEVKMDVPIDDAIFTKPAQQ